MKSAETLAQLAKTNRVLSGFVLKPIDNPASSSFADADLKPADVEEVPNPIRLDTTTHLMPGQGSVDHSEKNMWSMRLHSKWAVR